MALRDNGGGIAPLRLLRSATSLHHGPERRAGRSSLYAEATERGQAERASIAAALLAWYDRERRALALAGGARRDARSLPRVAERDHAAADHGQGGAAALRCLPAPLARCDGAGRAPSLARCSPPGPGSAITPARATCMLAPAPWRSGMAASFPQNEAALRKLPGIGDYTAAAIAAIAFGERATPVDGNIERVVARLFAVTTPLPEAKAEIRALAETLTPDERAGDFAQAMMDLGRHDLHAAPPGLRSLSGAARLPGLCRRARRGAALSRGERRAAGAARRGLRRAPRRTAPCCCASGRCEGLLGGMLETPSSPWAGGRAERKVCARLRAARGRLAQAARPRRAHLHAFPPRACGLSRRGRARCAAEARRRSPSAAAGSSRASFAAPRCPA